ncbi:Ubiquitin carboxyl-terminal hydrolase 13 [Camellia lanceoleosa]|uniref:Ubiquitin carboxyl-terminal hydrolase 13 n=1 Tax=Camellia lanceoleosa TaxID=1840588 RepID=A0ACC0H281_9ERIC|nr:Ubiquitin carboxyl-terminal hydrolase 13 [Camellia lanceoleosa]
MLHRRTSICALFVGYQFCLVSVSLLRVSATSSAVCQLLYCLLILQRRDVYGAWEQYLGLEHSDNTPKRSYAANQNRHTFEKPVRIYN